MDDPTVLEREGLVVDVACDGAVAGDITVRNEGQGCRFTIRLPLVAT